MTRCHRLLHQPRFTWRTGLAGLAVVLLPLLLASCSSGDALVPVGMLPPIRVSIADPRASIELTCVGGLSIRSDEGGKYYPTAGRIVCTPASGGAVNVAIDSYQPLLLTGTVRFFQTSLNAAFTHGTSRYTDTMLVVNDGSGLRLINLLPLETYLQGVVPSEIGPDRTETEFAAVQAQAVIARSYAVMKIRSPLTRLFDVHADTRDQVYRGSGSWTPLGTRAVRETQGLVVARAGRVAECYYHSTCGGRTEAVSLVWSRAASAPWLTGITDNGGDGDYCHASPSWRWSERYTRRELEDILKASLPTAGGVTGTMPDGPWYLYDIRIAARHPSGRVATLLITMGNGDHTTTYTVQNDRVRWALRRPGTNAILRSSLFDVAIERDATNWITNVRIDGAGNGHGIGLCQWGAIGRARLGQDFRTILAAYYPGTTVRRLTDLEDALALGTPCDGVTRWAW